MTITLYHGTRAAYLPAIIKAGLLPCAKPGNDATWQCADKWVDEVRKQSVFVSPTPLIASLFAERLAAKDSDRGIILKIELPEAEAGRLHVDEAGASDDNGPNDWCKPSDFQRFDGPIKREWIVGYAPDLGLLNKAALKAA